MSMRRPDQPRRSRAPSTNIPAATLDLIGRTAAIAHLWELLSAYRVVSLVGPGGIGKTALALQAARSPLQGFDADRLLVELASLPNAELVPSAVASVLGIKLEGEDISAETVARAIGARRLLLILDNCEHVVDAAARLTETIVSRCPGTTILATSREALRIDGEHVYRVPALGVPPEPRATMEAVLEHTAVELFMTRARALGSNFEQDDENLGAVAAICRRLDGIPLAIEFAAARAVMLGPPRIAALLDDRFKFLTTGRRTALPRHQTLRATLDWSYDLLPEVEAQRAAAARHFRRRFPSRCRDRRRRRSDAGRRHRSPCQPGGQVSGRRRHSRRPAALPPAGHDARLRAGKAARQRRISRRRPPSCRVLSRFLCQCRSRERVEAAGRMARHLRPAYRQCTHQPRLGLLAGRRCADRRGLDRGRGAVVGPIVAARRNAASAPNWRWQSSTKPPRTRRGCACSCRRRAAGR